jgi:K+-sensing histidine kinase KdpD
MARKASAGVAGTKSKKTVAKKTRAAAPKGRAGTSHDVAMHSAGNRERLAGIAQMRTLAHDLSNALEAILQAAYLLGQSQLDESPRRWSQLIDSSSQEAARLNREIRKLLRAMSEE